MNFKKYTIPLLFLVAVPEAYAKEIYFPFVGDENGSRLRASFDVYKTGEQFANVVTVLEDMMSVAKNGGESEFNKAFTGKAVLGNKNPQSAQKRWFKNMSSVTKFDPQTVIVNGEYSHLTTNYTLENDRNFAMREDFQCAAGKDCKFYLGDEISQDFERRYSAYKRATKDKTLVGKDNSFINLSNGSSRSPLLFSRLKQLDSTLVSAFSKSFEGYHQKVVKTYDSTSEEEYAAAVLKLFGFESGSKQDRFMGLHWLDDVPSTKRSDMGIYRKIIKELGKGPEVFDYFVDDKDNNKVYFIVANSTAKHRMHIIAYDSNSKEIFNPRKERSFRTLLSPSLILQLRKQYLESI